jgi:hypothetical protein
VLAKVLDSDFSLKRSGRDLTLLVARGVVEAKGKSVKKDQILNLSTTDTVVDSLPFTVLTPFPNDRLFVTDRKDSRVRFAWSGLPKKSDVALEVSEDGKNFKSVWNESSELADAGEEKVVRKEGEGFFEFTPGVWYWRLTTKNKNGKRIRTPNYKLFVYKEDPPQLISPRSGHTFVYQSEDDRVRFHWKNPSRLESLILEVSRSSGFENNIVAVPVSNNDHYYLPAKTLEGDVFWRMSGFPHDSSEVLASPAESFKVVSAAGQIPPVSSAPSSGTEFWEPETQEGEHEFTWEPLGGIANYRVVLFKTGGEQQILESKESGRVLIPELKEGEYNWILEAKVADNWTQVSEKKSFLVKKSVGFKLKWSDEGLSWKGGKIKNATYLLKVSSVSAVSESIQIKTKKNSLGLEELPDEPYGILKARVFAIGKDEEVIGVSNSLWIYPDVRAGKRE